MAKQSVDHRAAILGLLAAGFLIVGTQSAFAQYRHQKSAMCRALVNPKGLKGDQRKAEYQKCMLDPQNYK